MGGAKKGQTEDKKRAPNTGRWSAMNLPSMRELYDLVLTALYGKWDRILVWWRIFLKVWDLSILPFLRIMPCYMQAWEWFLNRKFCQKGPWNILKRKENAYIFDQQEYSLLFPENSHVCTCCNMDRTGIFGISRVQAFGADFYFWGAAAPHSEEQELLELFINLFWGAFYFCRLLQLFQFLWFWCWQFLIESRSIKRKLHSTTEFYMWTLLSMGPKPLPFSQYPVVLFIMHLSSFLYGCITK